MNEDDTIITDVLSSDSDEEYVERKEQSNDSGNNVEALKARLARIQSFKEELESDSSLDSSMRLSQKKKRHIPLKIDINRNVSSLVQEGQQQQLTISEKDRRDQSKQPQPCLIESSSSQQQSLKQRNFDTQSTHSSDRMQAAVGDSIQHEQKLFTAVDPPSYRTESNVSSSSGRIQPSTKHVPSSSRVPLLKLSSLPSTTSIRSSSACSAEQQKQKPPPSKQPTSVRSPPTASCPRESSVEERKRILEKENATLKRKVKELESDNANYELIMKAEKLLNSYAQLKEKYLDLHMQLEAQLSHNEVITQQLKQTQEQLETRRKNDSDSETRNNSAGLMQFVAQQDAIILRLNAELQLKKKECSNILSAVFSKQNYATVLDTNNFEAVVVVAEIARVLKENEKYKEFARDFKAKVRELSSPNRLSASATLKDCWREFLTLAHQMIEYQKRETYVTASTAITSALSPSKRYNAKTFEESLRRDTTKRITRHGSAINLN